MLTMKLAKMTPYLPRAGRGGPHAAGRSCIIAELFKPRVVYAEQDLSAYRALSAAPAQAAATAGESRAGAMRHDRIRHEYI